MLKVDYATVRQLQGFDAVGAAQIEVLDVDGVVRTKLALERGFTPRRAVMPALAASDEIRFDPTKVFMRPLDGGRCVATAYGEGAGDTAANPDFVPANYTQVDVQLRNMLKTIAKQSKALERREKRLAEKPVLARAKDERAKREEPEVADQASDQDEGVQAETAEQSAE